MASHELRTPMTSLTLSLQTLLRAAAAGKALDPKSISGLVDLAFHQGERLTRLISDLLDVSRIDERAAEMGVEGLRKPIQLPKLLAKIEQFCGGA